MKEIIGDFWKEVENQNNSWDAICCMTNGVIKSNGELVMGGGIAKDFAQHFPFLPKEWGARVKELIKDQFSLPTVLVTYTDWPYYQGHLVSFPTKKDWKLPSLLELIDLSAVKLKIIADALDWQTILLTRPVKMG